MTTPKSHSKRLRQIGDAGRRQRPDQHARRRRRRRSRLRAPTRTCSRRRACPCRPAPCRPCGASTRAAALARRSAKSTVIGCSPTRPRTPSVPKYLRLTDSISVLLHSRRAQRAATLTASTVAATSCARTMRAPCQHRRGRQRDAAGQALARPAGPAACRSSTCATGRPAPASPVAPALGSAAQQREIVLEASCRSRYPDRSRAGRARCRASQRRDRARAGTPRTSRDDVVVVRLDLHRARLALHVHQADRRAGCGGRFERAGSRSARTSLISAAPAATAARITAGLLVSTEIGTRACARERFDHRDRRGAVPPPRRPAARRAASTRRRRR